MTTGGSSNSAAPLRGDAERIFYDGDCGVCHWSVGFVARHDRTGEAFRFAPLGGEAFRDIVAPEVGDTLPDSIAVQTRAGELLLRSDGVVHILRRIGGFWRFLGRLLALVPKAIRDFFYDRFAERRHLLAGKPDGVCPLMPPELRLRFDP
jgi:predicted DCC family thiol-disulfide oxidoreductase YuxK